MKVTMYSNYLNHHQLPFCRKMDELTDHQFTFVAANDISEMRKNLGYQDMNKAHSFVLTTYDSEENAEKALKLNETSDVVIYGACPDIYLKERVKQNLLSFRYTERIHKLGPLSRLSPLSFKYRFQHLSGYENVPLYVLCAGAYVPYDLASLGCFIGKTYKWGYFPGTNTYQKEDLLSKKSHNEVTILWCARFLDWKHPEAAVNTALYLKQKGYSFHLNMIGQGEQETSIRKMIIDYGLQDEISLLGAMPTDQVRSHMETADIFLFTSDFKEGWGAVLNESMNSGCAVVCSHAVGSAGFLINHGINGLLYRNGDQTDLNEKTERLVKDSALRKEFGWKAYETITEMWNADSAAERFLELSEGMLNKKPVQFQEGPCSKADVISQNDMYQVLTGR